MITTVMEVQTRLLEQAALEDDPGFRRRYLMLSPGCSQERVALLEEKVPSLSKIYLKMISLFSLNGVIVGNFHLSPYAFDSSDAVDGFLQACEDPFFPPAFMKRHNIYNIGSWNTDLLCIACGSDLFKPGEILYIDEGYDIYNPEDSQIRKLARDFEQFLIVAGNLEQLHEEVYKHDSNREEKREEKSIEFIERLKALGVDEKYHKAWLWVF